MQTTAADLVRQYQAGIWRYLRYLGSDDAMADDLTQETFLAVIRKPFERRGDTQTAAYLRTVARHKFLRAAEKSRRVLGVEDLDIAETVWAGANPDGTGNDYLDALDDCLEQLNGRARAAINGRYRDGRSRAEIAEELDMTVDGVKTLLRRTRNSLRQCIQGRLQR